MLDANGLNKKHLFVDMYESGKQARKETVLTVTKPTSYLLRVVTKSNNTFNYDVTIEDANKASAPQDDDSEEADEGSDKPMN